MEHRNVSVVIFYTDDGRLLLQDREGISKFGEEYDFFGGGMEDGETPEQALARELKEEINYKSPDLKFFKTYNFKIDENNSRTCHVFSAKAPDIKKIKVLEGKGTKLFAFEDALKLKLFPKDKDILLDFGKVKSLFSN